MKHLYWVVFLFLVSSSSALANVTVSSPGSGVVVNSPVHYQATASATSCPGGVASIGVYVNNQLAVVQNGSTLSTDIVLTGGPYHTVVQEWDRCGGASYTPVDIAVAGAGGGTGGPPSGVTVSSPTNNSTVTSPATYAATASAGACSSGIASMGIYVSNQLVYVVNGATINTQLNLNPGLGYTVVQAWDNCGGSTSAIINVAVQATAVVTTSLSANPISITAGTSASLKVNAANANQVTITGTDGSSYTLPSNGGTQSVKPTTTTAYTVNASGTGGTASASATVNVLPAGTLQSINHVIFMLQENHSFDNYFGMLNPYRKANGWNIGDDGKNYVVDGIDDKLTSLTNYNDENQAFQPFKLKTTCVDDLTSSWLESYGDVSRWDFSSGRAINMDGFVHTAEGFAKTCTASGVCSGSFTDLAGKRAMGYYDQDFLNYYYYMASQFAISDRWFSPISSKSIDNRIATYTGGTTQGLVFDPGSNDRLPQLNIQTIFQKLDQAGVPWKIYYTVTQGYCIAGTQCGTSGSANYPATDFSALSYSYKYMYENPTGASCTGTTQGSSVVGDSTNSFCIDPNHITPLANYYNDANRGTLPSFAFIEAGSGINDEHPGSGQSILSGQAQVSKVINGLMASPSWKDSVFFLSYDEGGGPFDHVPPVPGHSNDNTNASLGSIPDILQIAVNADQYTPCVPGSGTPGTHCDLFPSDPGSKSSDSAAIGGFAAQLGFRVPNMIVSPFTRRHYVSHTPMDHTAIIKFVESRFISTSANLTARDAAQSNLLEFFDFANRPWATAPTPPTPVSPTSLGYDPCLPTNLGP